MKKYKTVKDDKRGLRNSIINKSKEDSGFEFDIPIDGELNAKQNPADIGIYKGCIEIPVLCVVFDYEIECKKDRLSENNRLCKFKFVVSGSNTRQRDVDRFVFALPSVVCLDGGYKLKFEKFSDDAPLVQNKKISNWNRNTKTITCRPDISLGLSHLTFNSEVCVSKDSWIKIRKSFEFYKVGNIRKVEIGELMFPTDGSEYGNAIELLKREIESKKPNKQNNRAKVYLSEDEMKRKYEIAYKEFKESAKVVTPKTRTTPENEKENNTLHREVLMTRILQLEKTVNDLLVEIKKYINPIIVNKKV